MALFAVEVHLRRDGLLLHGVAARAWLERPALDAGGVQRVPLALNASEAGLNQTHLQVGASSWRAGERSGAAAPVAYTATALEAGLDTNLTLPVPLTILHNATSPHAFASFLAAASTLRWRARVGALGASGGAEAAAAAAGAAAEAAPRQPNQATPPKYAVHNHPLPLTEREELRVKLVLAVLSALFVLIPFCYIPASAAVFVVKERASKAQHLQLVSGASACYYGP